MLGMAALNRKYSEKKVINFFRDLRSKNFGGKSVTGIIFRARCLKVYTGTYFVTKKALDAYMARYVDQFKSKLTTCIIFVLCALTNSIQDLFFLKRAIKLLSYCVK